MLKIALAQINPIVGNIAFNQNKILNFCQKAKQLSADIVLFPELSLCGYPPEDLLLDKYFIEQNYQALKVLLIAIPTDIVVVLGMPILQNNNLYNKAIALKQGVIIAEYAKQQLPNYGVFDEKRYFTAGTETILINIKNYHCALSICEDLWCMQTAANAKKQNADLLLNLNASPYHKNKLKMRLRTIQKNHANLPLIYVNQVGGQDELVFDGSSFVVDKNGNHILSLKSFDEDLQIIDFNNISKIDIANELPSHTLSHTYQALVLATKDYLIKNNFTKIILGLSGGIDSAVVLCIAVAAMGAENVEVIMMPSRYNLDISLSDALQQVNILKVKYKIISIEPLRKTFLTSVDFLHNASGITEENLQARIRGTILMARSNQTGAILLSTSNKSEISVGYATIYGDMSGGFAPLKDVYKTEVYALSKWLNKDKIIIPERVITRDPSAELSFNQKDLDSLPNYDVLDAILMLHIEKNQNTTEIIAAGFPEKLVCKIINLVKNAEHKRRQSPPGVKISEKNYNKDRRYPITNHHVS